MNPTHELYQSLLIAYQHFNKSLFEDSLPEIIFTVQRQKGILGYFAPDRWSSVEGKHCHEIAVNPTHLGQSRVVDICQTLVHEMVHCWQHCFGTPGRGNYHNHEWAQKMIQVGLQPTSTGLPGGKIVGPQMGDYPIEGGQFIKSCESLIQNHRFVLSWIDRQQVPKSLIHENSAHTSADIIDSEVETSSSIEEPNIDVTDTRWADSDMVRELMHTSYEDLLPESTLLPYEKRKRSKTTYQCPSCTNRVWGKPGMKLICGDCEIIFLPLE